MTIVDVEAVLFFREPDKVHAVNRSAKPIRDHRLRADHQHVLVCQKHRAQV